MRPVTVDHKYLVSLCLDTLYIMAGTYSLGYLGTLTLKIESEKHQYIPKHYNSTNERLSKFITFAVLTNHLDKTPSRLKISPIIKQLLFLENY